jgi:integrase
VEVNGIKGEGPAERTTIRQYRQHINLHIVPRIGKLRLAKLMKKDIENFRHGLLKGTGEHKALSRALARKVLTSLKSMLKAGGCGHIAADVTIGNKKLDQRRLEVGRDIPAPDEIQRLLGAAKEGRGRALLLTAVFTGLRASELRGLRWSGVDLKRGKLHVRQHADRYNDIGAPKSNESWSFANTAKICSSPAPVRAEESTQYSAPTNVGSPPPGHARRRARNVNPKANVEVQRSRTNRLGVRLRRSARRAPVEDL